MSHFELLTPLGLGNKYTFDYSSTLLTNQCAALYLINKKCCILGPPVSPVGSVTFEGKQRTVLFSYTLTPLRYLAREGLGNEVAYGKWVNGDIQRVLLAL